MPEAFKWMKKWQKAGARLILWTMRSDHPQYGPTLTQAVEFCRKHGVEFWAVNGNPEQIDWTSSPKALASLYVDDCAYGCPLTSTKPGQRKYVDWSLVGPAVLARLKGEPADV